MEIKLYKDENLPGVKIFDGIQIKMETFSLFNQKKKNFIEQIKSSIITNKNNISENSYSLIMNAIKELLGVLMLEKQNAKEILQILNGNENEESGHSSFQPPHQEQVGLGCVRRRDLGLLRIRLPLHGRR